MVFALILFGPGTKNGASALFGCTRKLLQLATNLQPRNQEYVTTCFPTVTVSLEFPWSFFVTVLLVARWFNKCAQAQGLTYKVSAGWSPRDNMAIIPRFDGALTALEAVPYGHLKTPWHLASFLHLSTWNQYQKR